LTPLTCADEQPRIVRCTNDDGHPVAKLCLAQRPVEIPAGVLAHELLGHSLGHPDDLEGPSVLAGPDPAADGACAGLQRRRHGLAHDCDGRVVPVFLRGEIAT
jgi:hypothetical protein